MGTIKVKLRKSTNSVDLKMKACVHGLGLKKVNSVRVLENTPSVRGMIKKVIHLVTIIEEK